MGKKGKNKLPKDERPFKAKARKCDHLKTPPPKKAPSTKRYAVSSATKHISNITIDHDDVDDILKLLLELEMNEKGFDSIDSCVASMMQAARKAEKGNYEGDRHSDSDNGSDGESDSDGDSDGGSDSDEDCDSKSQRSDSSATSSESEEGAEDVVIAEKVNNVTGKQVFAKPNPPSLPEHFVLSPTLRKFMKRKLMRDDRKMANEMKARQYTEKLKQKAIKKERYEKELQAQTQQKQSGVKSKFVTPSAQVSAAPPASKLRILVCSQKSKSSMKLMMIDRDKGWSVAELIGVVRTKLNEPKKFNALMKLPSKESFEDEDIRFFKNDTQLCLHIEINKKTSKKSTPQKKEEQLIKNVSCKKDVAYLGDTVIPGNISSFSSAPDGLNHELEGVTMDIPSPICNDESLSMAMRENRSTMRAAPKYQSVLQARTNLPMFKARESFLNELHSSASKTLIVVGDTGCGKTTQVPQIILDDLIDRDRGSEAYIICTQPRRIAAISVAERVAHERLQRCGQSVGYQIRLKSKCSQDTRILFCTTGILLKKIQDKEFLNKVSHIVIDEVHERQVETDFLLAILKAEMPSRHHLQLVLMSATLNSDHLREYMSDCPVVQVPGRLFPVTIHYMDDINNIIKSQQKIQSWGGLSGVVKEDSLAPGKKQKKPFKGKKSSYAHQNNVGDTRNGTPPIFNADTVAEFIIRLIERDNTASKTAACDKRSKEIQTKFEVDVESKAILVFLYGIQPITAVMNMLRHRQVLDLLKAKVFVLHSSIPAEQQSRVFAKLPAPFEWKIVLSTNIAESSVTVDDVVHVIDTGFHREMTYDPVASVSLLSTVYASKASLTQRSGRAGRVRAGDCWRLFSEDFMTSPRLQEYSLPEIRRVPLEDVVLQILILQLGNPRVFLSRCMDPPSAEQVDEALHVLLEIGAIVSPEGNEGIEDSSVSGRCGTNLFASNLYDITPLGLHLANLPVDVRLGKMLIYASIFGCLEPALTIVATLSGKSPMVVPPNKRDEANHAHSKFCTASPKSKHPFFSSTPISSGLEGGKEVERTVLKSKADEEESPPSLFSPNSDHLAYVRIYDEFIRVHKRHSREGRRGPEVHQFCKMNHLSMKILDEITALREQFRRYLSNAGFLAEEFSTHEAYDDMSFHLPPDAVDISANHSLKHSKPAIYPLDASKAWGSNHFSASDAIVRCVICAGLFPRVVRVCKVQSHSSASKSSRNQQYVQRIFESSGDTVGIHACSLMSRHTKSLLENDTAIYKDEKDKKKEAFVAFYKKISSPLAQLFDCTEVSPMSLILFGESYSELVKSKRSKVVVNKWIHLGISEENAVLIRKLKYEIEQILLTKARGRCDGGEVGAPSAQYILKKQFLVTSILEKLLEQLYT